MCLQNEQGQEIQLFVEGKDLVDLDFFSVSDPICVLYTKEALVEYATPQWNGETEVIDNNLNPKWIKHFNVWYNFVKDLELRFEVQNYNGDSEKNDLIGSATLSLSKLMTATKQCL